MEQKRGGFSREGRIRGSSGRTNACILNAATNAAPKPNKHSKTFCYVGSQPSPIYYVPHGGQKLLFFVYAPKPKTAKQYPTSGVSHPIFSYPADDKRFYFVCYLAFRDPTDLQGKGKNPQPPLEGAHDVLEIGPLSVHFVNKRDRRDLVLLRRAPHRF